MAIRNLEGRLARLEARYRAANEPPPWEGEGREPTGSELILWAIRCGATLEELVLDSLGLLSSRMALAQS
jgi:hypothetical protein